MVSFSSNLFYCPCPTLFSIFKMDIPIKWSIGECPHNFWRSESLISQFRPDTVWCQPFTISAFLHERFRTGTSKNYWLWTSFRADIHRRDRLTFILERLAWGMKNTRVPLKLVRRVWRQQKNETISDSSGPSSLVTSWNPLLNLWTRVEIWL